MILPMDQYNQMLLENAHPCDWVNPEPAKAYNLVVIGAGPGGLVTAAGAAGMGGQRTEDRRPPAEKQRRLHRG